jgi:uncharacterized membrane protein/nitrite reductase/ring-hydroxylating ferredoxin subunit
MEVSLICNIMKSTAHIKGHPIHPMLIVFPIAFFTGTFLFDLLFLITEIQNLYVTAMYLNIAGVVFALLAAVPGVIDFIYTVPPKSSGKKRALKHGIINVIVVIIFAFAFLYRQNTEASVLLLVGMEVAGIAALTVAGWMGGTLVYRNQIGVDPRTARAGKWREFSFEKKDGKVELDKIPDLELDQMVLLLVDNNRIVLSRTEKGLVAFDDHCTHRGGSLAGGMQICGTVQCPWHGSQFDVYTGEVKAGPAKEKILTYSFMESNGKIIIQL